MLMLVSSTDLVSLYVSLELATAPLYMLSGWSRTLRSVEAGIKYALLGALSSAFLLFGFSIIYGMSGEMSLALINAALSLTPATGLAIGFIITGVAFKVALVPFHMWAPDIYQGAPTPITAYLSVASKAAGVSVLFILWFKLFRHYTAGWQEVLVVLSVSSMTLGNVVAMVQQNIKRFMAYSSISQAGYILFGFLGPTPEGIPAILFYLLAYLVSNLAVFGVIIFLANATGRERIKDYAGLSFTNPILALCMMLGLFSLAGIPPLSGFTGKFFLFSIASKAGYHWLVALAALNSTASLYYYLRIVRQMYIEEPGPNAARLGLSRALAFGIALCVIFSVILGFLPCFYELIHRQTIAYLL
jgi:NADH-quinone oxidoreductase subunit N